MDAIEIKNLEKAASSEEELKFWSNEIERLKKQETGKVISKLISYISYFFINYNFFYRATASIRTNKLRTNSLQRKNNRKSKWNIGK